jgi:hypothetical protein
MIKCYAVAGKPHYKKIHFTFFGQQVKPALQKKRLKVRGGCSQM